MLAWNLVAAGVRVAECAVQLQILADPGVHMEAPTTVAWLSEVCCSRERGSSADIYIMDTCLYIHIYMYLSGIPTVAMGTAWVD